MVSFIHNVVLRYPTGNDRCNDFDKDKAKKLNGQFYT